MGRRSNVASDVFEIARRLPWWAGLLLAAGFYFFTPFLLTFVPQHGDPVFDAVYSGGMLFVTIVFQALIPIALVLGALASVFERKSSASLLNKSRHAYGTQLDPFADISWRQFERLTAAYFREQDYYVFETKDGPDGGVDLKLLKAGEVFVVQCKHWRARKIPVQMVRELFGIMVATGAKGAFLVASGQFTNEARNFSRGKNITLIQGSEIVNHTSVEPTVNIDWPPSVACPLCSSEMVLRKARKGMHAGSQFYGCSDYPKCRGIRQYEHV